MVDEATWRRAVGVGASPVSPLFLLLSTLFGDPVMIEVFSEERTVRGWLEVETALAKAQAVAGILTRDEADAITEAATLENIDLPALWREARNVGYPILPLIRMVAAGLSEDHAGRVHYGATTQDIMDTGLALQLREALDRLAELLDQFGEAVARLVEEHRHTVLAARTHAQQAVPTTLGTKLSVLLTELLRQRDRIAQVRPKVGVVSLFGAGGTSAALGESASEVRAAMAESLQLRTSDVPWHVARDSVAEFGFLCVSLAATCSRFAREIIDLSRTEIAEVREHGGHLRGASSTMPQKVNPINSEAIVGMAATSGALASALGRAMEAGHERAAGEWQIEWQVLPQLACLAAGCLGRAAEVAANLRVFPETMRRNLEAEGGLIMAEAYMMRLAPSMGRGRAHDLVYRAASEARQKEVSLEEALKSLLPDGALDALNEDLPLAPDNYVGHAAAICDAALGLWQQRLVTEERRLQK
jgi:3-carboxy-cis,cis-muconate cycloisomerase